MLKQIIGNKRKEVELAKKSIPLDNLKLKIQKSTRDFKKSLSQNKLNLIAEFKRKSPSGNIKGNEFNTERILNIYNKHADAISILTDNKFFSGSLEDMKEVSNSTKLPILRKDFIIDEYQIYEARFYNADAILLIASILSNYELDNFIGIAKNYGMECLVEVNTEEELNKVLKSNAIIIGINNRNLSTLKVDTETTLRLADKIPESKIVVSESGISSKDYIKKLSGRVNSILVGTLFMNSANLEEEIMSLIK